ncbi:unnamed protein product [Closterium sp. NIES-64]|nr:unnamed protein product [Closterium sp. NIES-64]
MAVPRALLVSVVCLFGAAATTAAGPSISSGTVAPRRNLTELRGSRRALEQIIPLPNPVAAALGAAAGAKLKAVLLEAATIASFVSQLPGGHFSKGASKVCEDFGALPACDFYFDLLGPLGLPSLRLPFVSQLVLLDSQRNGDRPVSLNIATSVSPSVDDIGEGKTKADCYHVEVDATGKAEYCNCKAGELATSVAHADDQFYATGEPARVYARTFQKNLPTEAFQGCCVRLPLASVQLKAPNGGVINLNKGDRNNLFPEERRCLLFHVLVL